MSPWFLLTFALLLTAAGWLWQVIAVGRYQTQISQLASQWRMHYSHDDRFRLSDRIAPRLPLSGAANVRVTDLVYGNEDNSYRYLFLVAYTEGVARLKARRRRVATFREPKDHTGVGGWSDFELAPEELTIVEQFKHLHESQKQNEPRPQGSGCDTLR
jgi:hypothetical protein